VGRAAADPNHTEERIGGTGSGGGEGQLLRVLAEDRGCPVFFSSHRLEELEQIAEYVGVFEHGKLMVESRLDDIKGDFRLIAKVSTLTTIDRLWVDCQRLAISGFWINRPASLKTLFCYPSLSQVMTV